MAKKPVFHPTNKYFLYTEKCIKTKACRVVKFNKNKHPIIKLDNMEIQQ